MRINSVKPSLQMEAKLSTMWIFVLLNMIFRDIHEIPKLLSQAVSNTVDFSLVTEQTLLVAGVVLEMLIAMVIASRLFEYRLNRWTNIIVGLLSIVLVVTLGVPSDLDDWFFSSVEVIALVFIVWSAWNWRKT